MFDPARFARLAAAEWAENRRAWLWFLGVGIMVHFVVVLLLFATGDHRGFNHDGQAMVFLSGLFLTAPIFAARYFQALSRPAPALLALMRPATTFEKWLLAFLVVAVAYPIAYHLAFYACDLPANAIARVRAGAELAVEVGIPGGGVRDARPASDYSLFHAFSLGRDALLSIALWVALLQGFAVAGSVVFRRMPFLKTVLAGFVVLLVSLLLVAALEADPSRFLGYWDGDHRLTAAQRIAFPLVWVAVPALLWWSAYLALRERELA